MGGLSVAKPRSNACWESTLALSSTSALTAGLLCDNSIMVKIKSSLLLAIHMKECAGKTISDLYDKGFSVPSSLPEV